MIAASVIPLVVFFLACGLVLVVLGDGRSDRLQGRLRDLAGRSAPPRREVLARLAGEALPRVAAPLMTSGVEQRTLLQARLLRAGHYSRKAAPWYLGIKTLLMFTPWVIGAAVGWTGLGPRLLSVTLGACASGVGLVGPGVWLDRAVARRQAALRRGLFDVLDLLVLCLEAGQSLPAAFQLVASEMRESHPALGFEMRIVHREMQLGSSLGQAVRNMADRCGLEEIAVLASTLEQTERLGASLVAPLRLQAEHLRYRRTQQAEERAQKAGGKVLFPTLLFIFPAVFIVLLGPAALQVQEVMKKRRAQAAREIQNVVDVSRP